MVIWCCCCHSNKLIRTDIVISCKRLCCNNVVFFLWCCCLQYEKKITNNTTTRTTTTRRDITKWTIGRQKKCGPVCRYVWSRVGVENEVEHESCPWLTQLGAVSLPAHHQRQCQGPVHCRRMSVYLVPCLQARQFDPHSVVLSGHILSLLRVISGNWWPRILDGKTRMETLSIGQRHISRHARGCSLCCPCRSQSHQWIASSLV